MSKQAQAEEPKKAARPQDPELLAMSRLDRMLSGMGAIQKQRVLVWLVSKHASPGFRASVDSPAPGVVTREIEAEQDGK